MSWQTSQPPLAVAVLAGGESAERRVSLASGRCVHSALRAAGHAADLWDPAEVDLAGVPWQRYDASFIALHGGAGEDGRIQQRLEDLHVPFTGSGPAASRVAMSKSASKDRFALHGVTTPEYQLFSAADEPARIADRVAELGFPLIFKPDSQGSSLGIRVAPRTEDVPDCLAACFAYDRFAIAEPLISGREFTVALVDREPLPMIEIIAEGRLFDYQAKYESPATRYRFDTGLSAATAARIYRSAVTAAEVLDTRGLVRVDLILDQRQTAWVLEVNTVPGMTDKSLAPRAAARVRLDMPRLCDRLVRESLSLGVSI